MHQEIEDIDGFGQIACQQHLDFFGYMRLREERRKAKGEGRDDEDREGDLIEQV